MKFSPPKEAKTRTGLLVGLIVTKQYYYKGICRFPSLRQSSGSTRLLIITTAEGNHRAYAVRNFWEWFLTRNRLVVVGFP